MLFLGLDPGVNGGMAVLDEDGKIVSRQPFPKIGDQIDSYKLSNIIRDQGVCTVGIEDVHSIFGSSAKSNFNFGRNTGILEGIVSALGLKMVRVAPKYWQKEMWQGVDVIKKAGKKSNDTKAMSLVAASRLFPNESFNMGKGKPHDGIVDAVLIAEYTRRKMR